MIFTFMMIATVGAAASAQESANDADNDFDPPGFDALTDGSANGPLGTVNELLAAHSDLSVLMEEQTKGSYEYDYPFTLTYVDEENEKLVVGLDPMFGAVGLTVEPSDIQEILLTTADIDIVYAEVGLESSSGAQTIYERNCTPDVRPGYIRVCEVYADRLISEGINPADLGPYTIFMDGFRNMRNWDLRGDEIEDRDLGRGYGVIPGHTTRNDVATNDDECETCRMELDDNISIGSYDSATLTFWRLLDSEFEDGEYVKVEIYDGSEWTEEFRWTSGDSRWHQHTVSLDGDQFNMRVTVQIEDDDHKFGIDNVIVKVENVQEPEAPADTTAPVISVPANISGEPRVRSLGFYTEFTVTATDDVDGAVDVECSHDSGYYQLGVTTVTCTAEDAAGNEASASFTITVTDSRPTDSDNDGFHDGIDQCPAVASSTNYGCPVPEPEPEPEPEPTPEPEPITLNHIVTCEDVNQQTESGFQCLINMISGTIDFELDDRIYGGTPHSKKYTAGNETFTISSKPAVAGTMGIKAIDNDGNTGIVISGHVAEPPNMPNLPYEDIFLIEDSVVFGYEKDNSWADIPSNGLVRYLEDGESYTADAAFIKTHSVSPQSAVKLHNGTIIEIVVESSVSELERHSPIMITGQYTNDEGYLAFKNATTNVPLNDDFTYHLTNQGIGRYDSMVGDSGSPIISITGTNQANIVGIHNGSVCIFYDFEYLHVNLSRTSFCKDRIVDENGLYARDPITGEYLYDNDVSLYKMISSWDNVKESLNLR